MSVGTTVRTAGLEALRATCGGAVHLPGDRCYDAARLAWNTAVDQRPAAVAYPADAEEVAAVVRAARRAGLRVAPQGTGRAAASLPALDDAVLLRTSAMRGVRVDPAAGRARVGAGALWLDVVDATAPHGLAARHGSPGAAGVTGFTLDGGVGWYSRSLGLTCSSVTAIELVTADGDLVRADEAHEPDLFWALRGGGGGFGVVTSLDFTLHPIRTAYAGALGWDMRDAQRVLTRWVDWAVGAPEEATTSARILRLPGTPEIPAPLRGRQLVMINGAVLAEDDVAARMIAPLRELGPDLDTFARMPAPGLLALHGEPDTPTPFVSACGLHGALGPEGVAAFLAAAGPGSGSMLRSAELRQLGGALGRPQPGGGALSSLPGEFLLGAVAVPTDEDSAERGRADARRLVAALEPWSSGREHPEPTHRPLDRRTAFSPGEHERLRSVRISADPTGLILANTPHGMRC